MVGIFCVELCLSQVAKASSSGPSGSEVHASSQGLVCEEVFRGSLREKRGDARGDFSGGSRAALGGSRAGHAGLATIQTARLTLKPVTNEMIEPLLEIYGNPQIASNFGYSTSGRGALRQLMKDEVEKQLGLTDELDRPVAHFRWGVFRSDGQTNELNGGERLVGVAVLTREVLKTPAADGSPRYDFWIGRALLPTEWGAALGQETAEALISHVFKVSEARSVSASVYRWNKASQRTWEKFGAMEGDSRNPDVKVYVVHRNYWLNRATSSNSTLPPINQKSKSDSQPPEEIGWD